MLIIELVFFLFSPKIFLIILGIILAFNLMLINYLGDFNEGSINSYGGIKIILKIISITLICLLSKVNKKHDSKNNISTIEGRNEYNSFQSIIVKQKSFAYQKQDTQVLSINQSPLELNL